MDWAPDGVSVQAGSGSHRSLNGGVGIFWDWDGPLLRKVPELSGQTEFMVNHWRASDFGGGHQHFAQLVLLPSLRLRLEHGRSRWVLELGVGASWMDKLFVTPQKTFSTQWNFYDVMGLAYTLGGPQGKSEIGARWIHVSNGSLREPNPGQDFLQLRYVSRF